MTITEVASMVAEIGLPFAFWEFKDDTAREPPFVCFLYTGSNDTFADNENYTDIRTLVIELYTADKDYTLEQTVRDVLNAHGLQFETDFERLDDERLYITTYTTEVLING